MVSKILDGKEVASKWLKQLTAKIQKFDSPSSLALIRIGKDSASGIYLKKKEQACQKIGIKSKTINFEHDVEQDEIIEKIHDLNNDDSINGIIVQTPLPPNLNTLDIQESIDSFKDVDGFTTSNLGRLAAGKPRLKPATPAGIMHLLAEYSLDVAGKHCVVVGRSNTVGKPLAQLLLMENATITTAHSKTSNLSSITKQADFLFVAVGKPNLISGKMIKKGAVVVDVGINRLNNGKICGDVDFTSAKKVASYITPVPGGVGPMTVASLLANTVLAYRLQHQE
ncbi:MAG: bifunctional methylenetetrahydrofolate dehydrogenase/methenyltetrahydrofolate cyclohydrolase FolD [Candidatus Micrarchaeota archaeon]